MNDNMGMFSLQQLRTIRAALEFGQRFCELDMENREIKYSSALQTITEAWLMVQEEIDKIDPPH